MIGGQRILPADSQSPEGLAFYGELFDRLLRDVTGAATVTRYVGFQLPLRNEQVFQFFGIEVEHIEPIPPGLVAWELEAHCWRLRHAHDGRTSLLSEHEIDWRWQHVTAGPPARVIGEFAATSLPEAAAVAGEGPHDFRLTGLAHVDRSKQREFDDSIALAAYNPDWPRQFQQVADWLRQFLGPDMARRIEHFGSTAIPCLPAKPIIDVLVECPSVDAVERRVSPLLDSGEWEYWWFSDHIFLLKRNRPMGQRIVHIHIAPAGHRLWQGLAFRDHLRRHPADANRYAALKQSLAAEFHHDRERYTLAKTDFVREILERIRNT
ncbi:MAG: GrpB family protein [Candidatus Zhuqueibacterota bacterium]